MRADLMSVIIAMAVHLKVVRWLVVIEQQVHKLRTLTVKLQLSSKDYLCNVTSVNKLGELADSGGSEE